MSNGEKRIMRIALKAQNRETLSKFVKEFRLDIGGSGGPRGVADGSLSIEAYTAVDVLDNLKKAGGDFEIIEDATEMGRARQKEVGHGDRFEGGKKVPHGLGKKE